MSRKKRKKQSPAIVSCKKGLACLGLICAVQMLPQTVLADDSAVQVTPADSVAQVNPADSAVQVTPADSAAQVNLADSVAQVTPADSAAQANPADFVQQADPADAAAQNSSPEPAKDTAQNCSPEHAEATAQNSTADPAEAAERLPGDQKEEAVEGVPADDAASFGVENTQDNVPEVLTGNVDAGAAAVDDAESFEDESMPKSAPETSGSDADAAAAAVDKAKSPESEDVQDSIREAPENDANVNPAAPDEAVTGGNQMIADAELLAGEKRRGIEVMQQYGFSSRPKGDVDGIALFVGGKRNNGVIVAMRGECPNLEEGEVMVHSPFGSSVLLKKDGNIVMTPASGKKIIAESDLLCKGKLLATQDVVGGVTDAGGTVVETGGVSLLTHMHPTAAPGSPSTPTPTV